MNPDSEKNKKDISAYRDNSPVFSSYFKDRDKLFFMYKKTERIASAINLIAKLFPEKEPLRTLLSETALSLLPMVLVFEPHDEKKVTGKCSVLLSLLQIALDSSLISDMNYSIIKGEIENLASAMSDYAHKVSDEAYFPRNFFKVESHLISQEKVEYKGSIKDMSYKGQNNVLYKNQPSATAINKKDISENPSENKTARRHKILEIINGKGSCTIKDFSYVITDYSEKTIQRELGAMVLEGVLIKTGKKRWSTYSLNTA